MERDRSIDILKGIGILFVIIGHMSQYIPHNLLIYIYSFHMPLFFYVSGYLYKEKYENLTFFEYVKKRFLQLIYPYFTLTIINFLWFLLKDHTIIGCGKYILSFLYSNYIFDMNYVGAIWFLACLFIVEIFYFLLKRKKSNGFLYGSLILCLCAGLILSKINFIRLPFWIDIAFFGILFYHFGYFIKCFKEKHNINKIARLILIILMILFNILFCVLNSKYCDRFYGRIDLLYLYLGNYFYFFISAICGILSWQLISEIIGKNFILELFGKNTLIIMGIHIIILQILVKIFKILNFTNIYFSFIFIFVITSISSLIISLFIKKYLPIITNPKIKKGELNGKI